jgi:hypothetical protein
VVEVIAVVHRTPDFLTHIFLLSGCDFGAGDAFVYFGTQVDPSLELAYVDGIFSAATSETFIAEDPSAAVPGAQDPSTAVPGAGSASFTVRFVNDDYRKFFS